MPRENVEGQPQYTDPRAEQMERVVTGAIADREQHLSDESVITEEPQIPAEELAAIAPDEQLLEGDESNTVDLSTDKEDTYIIERDGEQFLQLNVSGEGRELSLSDARTLLQKNINADQLTREAVQAKQDAAKAKELYDTRLAELPTAQPAPHETPTRAADVSHVADAEEREASLTNAFQTLYDEGNIAESAKIFNDVLTNLSNPAPPQQPQLSPQEIANIARHETISTNSELDKKRVLQAAWDGFSSDDRFERIAQDETLKKKLDAVTGELQADPVYMATKPSYADIFEEAGKRTLDWIDELTGRPSATNQIAEQIESKKSAMAPPVSAANGRRAAPVEVKPQSNSDVIANMKRNRGQTM